MSFDHLPPREYYQIQRTTLSSKKEITNQQWEKLLLKTKYTHNEIPSLWSLPRYEFLLTEKSKERCNEVETMLIKHLVNEDEEEDDEKRKERYKDLCSKISRVSVFTEFGFYAFLFIPPFLHNGIMNSGQVFETRIDSI